MIKQKHPSGRVIVFDEKYHSFFMEDDPYRKLVSVTTLINKFFPVFDTETISKKYAKKHNLNQNDVKKMWKEKGLESSFWGNRCHNYADALIRSEPVEQALDQREAMRFSYVKREIKTIMRSRAIIGSEVIIASPEYGIAGVVDLIERKNNILFIEDWKTSETIKMSNIFQKGCYPVEHLEDTNYNHYMLQLNIYLFILLNEGYFDWVKDWKLVIKHVCGDDYVVDSLQEIIKMMLNEGK